MIFAIYSVFLLYENPLKLSTIFRVAEAFGNSRCHNAADKVKREYGRDHK